MNENKKFIINKIRELSSVKSSYMVFNDMIICCAYALANQVDYNQEREDSYNNIIKVYGEDGKNSFAQILAKLYLEYSKGEVIDVLGEIYEEMGFHNKNKGQFFTPLPICSMMAKVITDKDENKNLIENKGYISVSDPACGSGRMLYASYENLLNSGIDKENLLLIGDDVDLMCCCMTYIQLSLMGASAIVNHKNTLSNEVYDTFYTFNYVNNKKLHDKLKKEIVEEVEI